MESGEKEIRQAFEDVTTRNVKTNVAFSQDTRKLFRELEEKVNKLQNRVTAQEETIKQFRIQLAGVQTKLYQAGS